MSLTALRHLLRGGRWWLLWRVNRLFLPFYRLSFVASASSNGVLHALAGGPRSLDALAAVLAPKPEHRGALRAWLDLGVRIGELEHRDGGYALRGLLAKKLATPDYDDVAALVEEVAGFHHQLLWDTPRRLRRGQAWSLADHDAAVIARSSRILEPFVFAVSDRVMPREGHVRLLEVGCGAGSYLCHAAARNPKLVAVGLELRPEVAALAQTRLSEAGFGDRVMVHCTDVSMWSDPGTFDVVTLYNVIYYLPTDARVGLFRRLRTRLAPGGLLVLTTCCRGGSPGMQMLDVWSSSTDTSGPLPSVDELRAQLADAGFVDIRTRTAIPGEAYVSAEARAPDTGGERP